MGEVASAFHACERRRDQPQQETDDADDDQQLEERKTPNAFRATLRGGRSSEVPRQTQCALGLETVP